MVSPLLAFFPICPSSLFSYRASWGTLFGASWRVFRAFRAFRAATLLPHGDFPLSPVPLTQLSPATCCRACWRGYWDCWFPAVRATQQQQGVQHACPYLNQRGPKGCTPPLCMLCMLCIGAPGARHLQAPAAAASAALLQVVPGQRMRTGEGPGPCSFIYAAIF
jgi:hypothetical protein